jgi:hypothetical protein
MIRLTGTATTAGAATLTAQRGAQAFLEYLGSQQRAAGIPPKQRVVVQTVSAPSVRTATLVQGHKKTMPVLVFLAVALATVGAAFALENMRPAPAAARSDAGHPEPRVVEDAFGSASS